LEPGGTECQLYLTLLRLDSFTNVIVCLRNWGSIGEKLQQRGFSVYFIDTPHFFAFKSILKFKKILQNIKPDLMITYLPFADIFGRVWGKWFGVSKIVCFLRSSMREWRYFPLVLLNVTTQWLVDHFFSVSAATKEFYEKWGLKRGMTNVIHNGVEMPVIATSALRSRNDEEVVIGYVARLREERGHIVLFKAVKALGDRGINVRLVLVGDGPYYSQLKKKAHKLDIIDKIEFLGNRSDAKHLLPNFTIYCHPSLYEGMSNALLEAMMSGCAIVTTDIPENREMLKHRYSALLTKPKDPKALSEAIEELVGNVELRGFLAKNAKNAAKKFNIDYTINKLSQSIKKLLYA